MKKISGLKLTLLVVFISLLYTTVSVFAADAFEGDPAEVIGGLVKFLNPAENQAFLIALLFGATFVIIFDVVLSYKNWKASLGFGALVGVAFSSSNTMMAYFSILTGFSGFIAVALLMGVAAAGMNYKRKKLINASNVNEVETRVFKDNIEAAGNTRADIFNRIHKIQQQKAHISTLVAQKANEFAAAQNQDDKESIMKTITKYKQTLKTYDDSVEALKGQLEGIKLKEEAMSKEMSKEIMSD